MTPELMSQHGSSSAKAETSSKNSVQSLAKAFRLLEAIAASESDLTLSELASAASLDPGTTHRMLKTLIDLGYVARSEAKRFTLTMKVLDLGFRAIGHRDMRTLARPILRTLVGEVSEAASLGVLSGTNVLYIERMRAGIMRLGVDIQIGTMIPATGSVIGWAMLAYLPEPECLRLMDAEAQNAGAIRPIEPADVAEKLKRVRKQGFASGISPISNGIAVLAVPVLDQEAYPVAAVSVTAPSVRMTPDDLTTHALGSLQSAAKDISRGLQARGGTIAD
ncbi:MAG: IclR family transcriptional regulator [Proteobacteria bacterium]|nr:IclR family transcriptional regulator [Pseudomonadota bacterium]MCA0423436.1 IclR family transcriptional regulator [Pseudomonadota bacterium]